ncbi:hypothetical protein PWT90_02557 [Aphanocladium album]|nr:hypothetical protein PWT90_02557 [Aphanocladium album]
MSQTDVIMAIQDPYMDEIMKGTKNYEFRKYGLPKTVQRIWFHRTAPRSSLTHICEISPHIDRNTSNIKIDEDGRGNKEFNERHKDWVGYDFAHKILSVYEIKEPITLKRMMDEFSILSAPRRFVYLPQGISDAVSWKQQKKIFDKTEK